MANPPIQTRKWPDLSMYGLRLVIARPPSGMPRIVLIGGDAHAQRAQAAGFIRNAKGHWIYKEAKINLSTISAQFKGVRVVEMPISEVELNVVAKPKVLSDSNSELAETRLAMSQATPLGVNYLGQPVFEGADGRFVKSEESNRLRELDAGNPALFLRANSDTDLDRCADGLVSEIVNGRSFVAQDLDRFEHTVFQESFPENRDRLNSAITDALARRLLEETVDSGRDAYTFALRLHEGLPPLDAAAADLVVPLPMGVIAQRLLGGNEALKGKTLYAPHVGNGSLLSGLNADIDLVSTSGLDRPIQTALNVHRSDIKTRVVDEVPAHEVMISAYKAEELVDPINFLGTQVKRQDHLNIMRALEERASEGSSVFIINGTDKTETRKLLNWISGRYAVDGVVHMDGSLLGTGHNHADRLLLRVGKRGVVNSFDVDAPITKVFDYEALWDWSETFISAPQRELERKVHLDNSYQAPYVPMSQATEPASMIPRNLVGPTREALSKVAAKHGDIDHFVASELHYAVEELGNYLSAEQVDAVALMINAAKRGRGFIQADQTGMGKGRTLAAMARWAALNDKRTVFMSRNAGLFSDIYRDIQDTGSLGLFKPTIVNDKTVIRDTVTQDILVSSTPKDVLAEAIASGDMPEDSNLLMLTYTQINKKSSEAEPVDKIEWVINQCKDALVLLDESHSAAGTSNTAANVKRALDHSSAVMYSSATFAKNAEKFGLYAKALPASVASSDLSDILKKGGEPLAEVFSAMLTTDGVLIRREHDLSDLRFVTKPVTETLERNEIYSDKLAEILESMALLGREVEGVVNENNRLKEAAAELATARAQAVNANATPVKAVGMMSTNNFGSNLYAVMRQFMLVTKADETASLAIQALKEGQKPVIAVEQTMESLIKYALEKNREYLGDLDEDDSKDDDAAVAYSQSADLLKGYQDGEVLVENVTFRDVLYTVLDRMMIVRTDNGRQGVITERVDSEAFQRYKDNIEMLIDTFPDVPVNPIDIVKRKIEESGEFTCGEVSGRSLMLVDNEDGTQTVRKLKSKQDHVRTISTFNSGGLDALIVTAAGSTGYSMHSSPKFADQRQRIMVEMQSSNDVATRLQFLGRVNRKGQISPPIIYTVTSNLPAEARMLSMQNRKMAELSANTTSNRDSSFKNEEYPDLLNEVGSSVCREYLIENPEIATKIGLSGDEFNADDNGEGSVKDKMWFANKLTSRTIMLPVADQRRVMNELAVFYQAALIDLERKGENKLKSTVKDIRAKIHSRSVASSNLSLDQSVFDSPVYQTVLNYTTESKVVKWAAVQARIKEHELIHGKSDERITKALSFIDRDAILSKAVARGLTEERLNTVLKYAPQLITGTQVTYSDMAGEYTGVIVGVHVGLGKEHLPSNYKYQILCPGQDKAVEIGMASLVSDRAFKLETGMDEHSAIANEFDSQTGMKVARRALVLDGNMFEAARYSQQYKQGSPVVYTLEDGTTRHGIMLPPEKAYANIQLPISLQDITLAEAYTHDQIDRMIASTSVGSSASNAHTYYPEPLYSKLDAFRDVKQAKQAIRLGIGSYTDAAGQTSYVIRLQSRGGKYADEMFGDTKVPGLVEAIAHKQAIGSKTRGFSANIPLAELTNLLTELKTKGVVMYATPVHRERITEIFEDIYKDELAANRASFPEEVLAEEQEAQLNSPKLA